MLRRFVIGIIGSTCLTTCVLGADISSIGNLSERLDAVEKRLNGENPAGDELATKPEVEGLIEALKALTGRVEVLEHQQRIAEKAAIGQTATNPAAAASSEASSLAAASLPEEDDVEAVLESLTSPAAKTHSSSKKAATEKHSPAKKEIEEKRESATKKAEETANSTLETGSPAAQYNQAEGLLKHQQYAEAEAAFEHFLNTYPNSKEAKFALIHMGEAQLEQGKNDAAKATFAKAYKAHPKGEEGAKALLGLGKAFAAQDEKKACTVLEKLKEDFPNDKTIQKQANALFKKHHCGKKD